MGTIIVIVLILCYIVFLLLLKEIKINSKLKIINKEDNNQYYIESKTTVYIPKPKYKPSMVKF